MNNEHVSVTEKILKFIYNFEADEGRKNVISFNSCSIADFMVQ